MPFFRWVALIAAFAAGQVNPGTLPPSTGQMPAYVREGDRVEQKFRAYRERLDGFHKTLQTMIARDLPVLLPELEGAPPQPIVFGYQMLPRIVENAPAEHKPVISFSYSWPITEGYIDGEEIKLDRAMDEYQQSLKATGVTKSGLVLSLITTYKTLVEDQRIVDQYVEYNRLWQRSIAGDRSRYDEMTRIYRLLQSADADTANSIRQVLGQPLTPSFIQVKNDEDNHRVTLRVPVYTDIESDAFLLQAKASIESVWQAKDANTSYGIELDIRKVTPQALFDGQPAPKHGDHIDVKVHAARFPSDGVVLTTGAEMTNALVKRYVAFGPGDISVRTLAHEFGHLLGFPDGYIRGYKDLGEKGFEILELTSVFDDIMSSPRDGIVQVAHFKLLIETIKQRTNNDTN